MADPFDPYYEWLGIAASEQPPDHYRLLGIPRFEPDAKIIRAAADQRFVYLRTFQLSPQADLAERLLNEVAAAKICLLDPEAKAEYDANLEARVGRAERAPPVPPPKPLAPGWTVPADFPALPSAFPLTKYRQLRRQKSVWIAVVVGLLFAMSALLVMRWSAGPDTSKVAAVEKKPIAPPPSEKPRVAVYVVEVDPPSATVMLLGKEVSLEGSGASRTIRVLQPDGQRKVIVKATATGFEDMEQEIQPKPGQQARLSLRLKPAIAIYTITLDPTGAQVNVTGTGASIEGTATSRTIKVVEPDGQRRVIVKATATGFEDLEQEIQPKPGQQGHLSLRLKPVTAIYTITLDPPEAQLEVTGNGASVEGSGGTRTITVRQPDSQSKVRLSVSLDGYESLERDFQPKPGETETVGLRLNPLPKMPLSPKPLAKAAPPPAIAPFSIQKAKGHQKAWAMYLGLPSVVTNSIGMKLVLIPPGEFLMGSPENERDRQSADGPQHRVRITKPFYLGIYEVTQREYEKVIGTNPSHFKGATLPVDNVGWNEAVEFCHRLGQKEGREYRLPTEAQWEFACRAGTTTPFSFGSVLNGEQANCDGSHPYGTDRIGPFRQQTMPVGSYRPNDWSLYDVHGNLWEWCADWHDAGYYANSPVDDPVGPRDGSDRVVRGGCWRAKTWFCRSAFRDYLAPNLPNNRVGLRICLVLSDEVGSSAGQTVSKLVTPAAAPATATKAEEHARASSRFSCPRGATLLLTFEKRSLRRQRQQYSVQDLSGNGRTCIVVPEAIVTGKVGSGLLLNGRAYAIVTGNYPGGSNPRAIAAWVKSDVLNSRGWAGHVINYGTGGVVGTGLAFGFMIYGANRDLWFLYTHHDDLDSGIQVDTNWHHHCVQYDGTTAFYYFDGRLVAKSPRALNTRPPSLVIGTRSLDLAEDCYFQGVVDEIAVFDRVLTNDEIEALYQLGVAGTPLHP